MTSQKVTSSIIQESNYRFKIENKKLQNDTDKDNLPNLQHFSTRTGVNKPTALILKKQYCSGGGNEIS